MRAKDRGFTHGLTMTVPATRAFEADRDCVPTASAAFVMPRPPLSRAVPPTSTKHS
jgi:hypothetical protein